MKTGKLASSKAVGEMFLDTYKANWKYTPAELISKDRNYYINAARELHYPQDIIDRLYEAKTQQECDRIMRSARESL